MKRSNQGVNVTLEAFKTRGTFYVEFTNSKGVPLADLPRFPLAVCDSFEISENRTMSALYSSSESGNDRVRNVLDQKELAGTAVFRDFKAEALSIITGGKRFIDVEVAKTMTHTVKGIGEFIDLDGFAVLDSVVITADGGVEPLDEDVDYLLNDGNIKNLTQEKGVVLSIAYTKKRQVRIEASLNDEVYARFTFEGTRVGEETNDLYKVSGYLGQFDPSTFPVHATGDFQSWTATIALLYYPSAPRDTSPYYKVELADSNYTAA